MTKSVSKQARLHSRIRVNILVQVSTIDVAGKNILAPATIINVSRGGAAIQLPIETAFDSLVKIHWQDQKGTHEAAALPRWKYPCGDNLWRVGLESTDDRNLWSNLVYFACKSRGC
ncbi:MAG: PilZ domain-containing protein [Acidobacteria bacterium]|nr:PilZ domain-containing protein [Acidobacteriota bacterium]